MRVKMDEIRGGTKVRRRDYIGCTVKKGLPFSRPHAARMSLTKLSLDGNNLIMFCPGRVWSVTSRLGTGKSLTFFTVWKGVERKRRREGCRQRRFEKEGDWRMSRKGDSKNVRRKRLKKEEDEKKEDEKEEVGQ